MATGFKTNKASVCMTRLSCQNLSRTGRSFEDISHNVKSGSCFSLQYTETPLTSSFCQRSCASNDHSSVISVPSDLQPISTVTGRNHLTFLGKQLKSVDIGFADLTYSVPCEEGYWWLKFYECNRETKTILHSLHGRFKSYELSVIMGPSGAGKSSLMNILAGYKTNCVTGKIKVNGKTRNLQKFRKLSCYIQQNDYLLPHLTVDETMVCSANLKLSEKTTRHEKLAIVDEVLQKLSLYESRNTRVSDLSGGQRKRLSIALELISNPPVMFFDEPTSGLDSAACQQCVALLKSLARDGRTVICSIHQPNAKLFETFDQLYMMSSGQCIYSGPTTGLVPFLKSFNLICPPYHNAADFAIDVAVGEYGDHTDTLGRAVRSQWNSIYARQSSEISPEQDDDDTIELFPWKRRLHRQGRSSETLVPQFETSFFTQFRILFMRTFISILRDTTLTRLRLISNIGVGILIGLLYLGIGNDAAKVFNNAGFIFFTLLFILFTSLMPTVMTFPLEMSVFIHEHQNYWYSVKSYFFAKSMADVPFQIIFPVIYGTIVYWMTGQPNDIVRYFMFLTLCTQTALVSQSFGLLIGAGVNLQAAVFLGPVTVIPLLMFSGFFVSLDTIPAYLQWLSYGSYVRYSFEGSLQAIYGMERTALACSLGRDDMRRLEMCKFENGEDVLLHMAVDKAEFFSDFVILCIFNLLFRIFCFLALKIRLALSQ